MTDGVYFIRVSAGIDTIAQHVTDDFHTAARIGVECVPAEVRPSDPIEAFEAYSDSRSHIRGKWRIPWDQFVGDNEGKLSVWITEFEIE